MILTALLLAASAVPAGCGSDDDTAKALNQQELLRQARKEGVRDARLRQLERELREQKRQTKDNPSSSDKPSSSTSSGAPSAPSSGTTSCGNGLSVGPNTSCPFAERVRYAYYHSDDSTVVAASPVTGQVYTMSCTPTSPHVCRGGNDASVFFP